VAGRCARDDVAVHPWRGGWLLCRGLRHPHGARPVSRARMVRATRSRVAAGSVEPAMSIAPRVSAPNSRRASVSGSSMSSSPFSLVGARQSQKPPRQAPTEQGGHRSREEPVARRTRALIHTPDGTLETHEGTKVSMHIGRRAQARLRVRRLRLLVRPDRPRSPRCQPRWRAGRGPSFPRTGDS
jgi:hypothetical protein